MKPLTKIAAVAAAIIFAAVLLTGCAPSGKRVEIAPAHFNTVSFVAAYAGEDELLAAAEEVEREFAAIEKAVAVEGDTDIAAFNAAAGGETLEISETTYTLLREAMRLYEYTGGAYNPAVGRLIDLWQFSPRFDSPDYTPTQPYDRELGTPPSEEYVAAFRQLTDFGAVMLREDGGRYYAVKPSAGVTVGDGETYYMTIDLGGIAKGYAADIAAGILEQRGIVQSYVSVGTSSLSLLSAKKADWSVTLRHPRSATNYATVYAHNTAASTSGDYERYYEFGGKRYCHIIDPSTGAPTESGIATASVFGRTAAEDDALSTALCVMGRDRAIEFINQNLTDCRVFIVWYNAETEECEFITNSDGYELTAEDITPHSTTQGGKITYVA